MKDKQGHGSDPRSGMTSGEADKHEHHQRASMPSPSFVDYSRAKLGSNWEIGRGKTKPSEFAKVKEGYHKEHPKAAEAYFGKGVATR